MFSDSCLRKDWKCNFICAIFFSIGSISWHAWLKTQGKYDVSLYWVINKQA